MLGKEEINKRFDSGAPPGACSWDESSLRREFVSVATFIDQRIEDGREKSLALTELETAMMWALKAIPKVEVEP